MKTIALVVVMLSAQDPFGALKGGSPPNLPKVSARTLHAVYFETGTIDDADRIYAGRLYVVSGRVQEIGRVPQRRDGRFVAPDFGACRQRKCGAYVTLNGPVQALFHPDDDNEVAPLRRGQTVALGCTILGANTAATHVLGVECFVMPAGR